MKCEYVKEDEYHFIHLDKNEDPRNWSKGRKYFTTVALCG